MILDQIPGFKKKVEAAREEESKLRDFAYTGLPETICGVDVKQFTPRHFLNCLLAKSPFFVGGIPSPVDVGLFLWIVSPGFKPFDLQARNEFLETVIEVPYADAIAEIDAYIERAFFDRPSGGSSRPAVASFLASLVHEIASAYGWYIDQILDAPFALLYQQLRMIAREEDPRRPFPNRLSDKVVRELVLKHQKKQKRIAKEEAK